MHFHKLKVVAYLLIKKRKHQPIAENAKKGYIVANKDRVREMMHLVKEHSGVPNNVEFVTLKTKVASGRVLT